MQYKTIETKNHKSSFEVSLDQEAIGKIIDQKINEKQPTFEIAGFRKGKVPLNIIKSKIGQEVENEVLNEEISKNITEISEKEKLQSLIQPEIEFKDNYNFSLSYFLRPELKIDDLKDSEIENITAEVKDKDTRRTGEILKDLQPEDLLKFGLIPEFVGRLPVWASLEDLDEESLVRILTEPKNALIKQYKKLFDMENVELKFSDDALSSIAKKTMSYATGARGLRSVIESILLDTMFEIPSTKGVTEVAISREVVDGEAKPLYIYGENKEEKEKSVS